MRFDNIPFLVRATPASAGAADPVLVQSTPLASGFYSDAVAVFPSPVTPGNHIVILGALEDGTIVGALSTNQGDTITVHEAAAGAYAAAFSGYAVAVGGSTTITMSGPVAGNYFAQEWSGVAFDTGAGVGAAAGTGAITPTTGGSTTSAPGVSFSAWAQVEYSTNNAQTVPAGWTLIGRQLTGEQHQFIAAYRLESTVGVKSVAWGDDATGNPKAALILPFRSV